MALNSLNTLRLRETQTEKAGHAGTAACEAEEELNGRGSARLTWIGRRFARRTATLHGCVNHLHFGQRQENGGLRQEQRQCREGTLLFTRQLQVMLRRRMRLVLIIVVIVIGPRRMLMVMAHCWSAGCCTAAVMDLRQQMNPDVIDVDRKQGRR